MSKEDPRAVKESVFEVLKSLMRSAELSQALKGLFRLFAAEISMEL